MKPINKPSHEEKVALNNLVSRVGVKTVLEELAKICTERRDLLCMNHLWEFASQSWGRSARQLEIVARVMHN